MGRDGRLRRAGARAAVVLGEIDLHARIDDSALGGAGDASRAVGGGNVVARRGAVGVLCGRTSVATRATHRAQTERTRLGQTRVGVGKGSVTRHVGLRAGVRRSHGGSVRLVARTLLAGGGGRRGLRKDVGLLRESLRGWRRWWILARRLWRGRSHGLTGLLRIGFASAVRGQWLTVGTVELGVGWRVLTAPDGVSRDKGLGASGHGSKDTVLREAHTVGTATVFGLVEAGAANLQSSA